MTKVYKSYFDTTPEEIEDMASHCGFVVKYKEEKDRFEKFSFEKFVLSVYGGFGGLVDTKYMDRIKLQEFKEVFAKGEYDVGFYSVVTYVFAKSD